MTVLSPQSTLTDSDDGVMVGKFINRPVKLNSANNVRAELVAQIASFDKIPDKIAYHHLGVVT